jgi:hypothetical protein
MSAILGKDIFWRLISHTTNAVASKKPPYQTRPPRDRIKAPGSVVSRS